MNTTAKKAPRKSKAKSTNTRGKAKRTTVFEAAILAIVAERAPITVRGVAYALFTRGLIENMATNNTQKVSRVMTAMREIGALDWTQIVDGTRAVDRISTWRNPSQIIDAAVRGYRRNYWQDQPTLIEVWSEKSTVAGLLAPVLDEFGVTFRVQKGFGSFTSVRQAAEDSLDVPDHQNPIVLYIGDFDPSGMFMSEIDLPARLKRYGSQWQFQRIAVLKSDTKKLPSFDASTKASDKRYEWFVENYGQTCWELDAIDPNDLRQRVREQIETRLNLPAWEHAKHIEAVEVESMKRFHQEWQANMQRGVK
ncbi:MAG: hypothetical protein KBF66_04890 [Rhodoferax sp.]|uniref:hypothetical protein n=1 Tax=Rhodoferax sp. TaxID=50421 RepID=UPI001B5B5807|nr:hypothetical protein [Rhodoferax sp.]MBP9904872.1 hypothetical protein [Rhodoferax sp.]